MKRIFTRWLLMTVLLIAGLTTAVAQQSVLNENFANGTLPQGWAKAGNYWDFSEFNAKFFAPFENAKDTLYAPVVSLSELKNEPTVTFSYSLGAAGSNVNILTLLYRAGGQGAWTALDTFDVATDGKTSFVQALPAMASIQLAIAADYKAGGSTYVYQLRVANKKEATAAPANFKAENLQANGVKLTWDASESDYFEKNNLKLSTSPLTNPDAEMGDVKNFMDESGLENEWCEISDLEPNTKYYAYVQYDCGYGDVSPWAVLEFKTPCVAVSAPFSEDFEDGLPDCFKVYKQGSATTAEVNGEYPYNSMRSFKVNIEGTSGFYNYLILPELEDAVKKYQISFMAASDQSGNTYARRVAVGVCTDANDEAVATTFTEITTLDLPKGRTWENVVVSLKGYTGDGKYIVLKIGHPSMKTNLYIDDIKVEAASECPKPMFIQASNVSTSSAKIGWTKTGNENEWNLVVSLKPLSDPEDIEPNESKGEFAGSVSANPYTLTGLKPNTTYYVYVQAACGSSEWTEAISFKTHREVSYPYAEHFDRLDPDLYTNNTASIPDSWVFDDRGNNPDYASYYDKQYTSDSYRPYVTTAQNHEQTAYVKASLLLRGTSGTTATSTNYTSIAMLPAMPKAVNTMMVTFWAYASAAQTVKIGVANTQTNELAPGKQLGENITEVGEAAITGGSEWKQYKVLLTSYAGTGRYITFYLKPGTSTPSVYIDDIEIDEAPDCNAVSTVSAEATGIDKATATWTDASSSTSWTIKVSSTEIDPASADGDIVASKTVNDKSYNITGLSMGGTYYIYVSPSCGDAWKSTTVTTLVGLQVPYYNDFTNENTGANATRGPANWKLGFTYTDAPTATSTYYPYVNNLTYAAANNPPADAKAPCLYVYTGGTSASYQFPYAIMPELLNADVKDLKMSFYGYYNSTTTTTNYAAKAGGPFGVLHIGVVKSPSDINKTDKFTKVTEVATVRCSKAQTVEMFVVDLSSYTGNGKYIVFYEDTAKYNYFGIDNLTIARPSDPWPVSEVAVSEITQTGAKLAWKENGSATKWEVRVFNAAQDDPAAGEPAFSAIVTDKEATITGLICSTKYFAYVRSMQDNGNGAWGSTNFRTECGLSAVPFTEDWESYATGANTLVETCYEQTNGAQVAGSSAPNATVKTGQVVKLNATTSNKEPMIVFPALDKPIKTLQLTMAASPYTSSYVGDASYTEIGVLEEGDNFVKVAEYRFNLSDVKAWDECFVNFGSYTGEGGRIAIRSPYATVNKQTHICFDNVVIEQIPLCGRITSIEVEGIDSVSANISWAKGKTENAWNLKISSTELEDPAIATADVFDAKVTEQTKAINGLEGNTTYYVYVQSVDETLECEGQWSNAKSFKTLCKKKTFPYEEDFESYETNAGKDLGCNTLCGPDANHSYISTKGGSKALYLRQATKGNHNYFVFPALAIDSVKRLQLSMQVYSGGTTATTKYAFEVGIMTDPNDPSSFVATHKDTVMGASTAYDRAYTFENYAGDETGTKFGTFIALKATEYTSSTGSTSAGYVYIDNVYIDFIETCFAPTDLKTDSVGTYGAEFSWLTDDKTAAHRIRIFDDATAKPNDDTFVKEVVVSDTTKVLIEGLQSLTKYYAFVRKECSANDKSKWSSVCQFRTECPETVTLPYAEDFEAFATSTAPDCWTAIQGSKVTGAAGSTAQANATVVTTAASGSRGLQISTSGVPTSTGANPSYVYSTASIVTPKLDVNSLKDITMYFDVKGASAGATLKIEAVADKEKDADAIYITTLSNIPATWMKAYLKLEELYTSVQPYKYLRFTPTTNGNSIYIDNIVFTTESNVVLPVEALKTQMLSESTIKFSFAEYTPTINQWQVAYVVAGGDIADAKIQTIDATEYTITGLAPNTTYDIYVRGNVEGDQWVGPLTATTIQTPAPLPIISGFEDDADQWILYNLYGDGIHTYPNFWIVGKADSCAGTGENALFITNDSASYIAFDKNDGTNMDPVKYAYQGSNITATSYVWATRNIKVDAAGTYKFSIKFKVPKCYSSDGLYAQLIPAGATFKAGTATLISGATRSGSATTATDANGCYLVMGKQLNVEDWTWYNTSLDIVEPGIYTLALYWYNPSAGDPYATPAAIDSVIVEEYLCTTPKNIEFVERKADTVTLKWFGGKCKNFEYVVSRYANLGMPNLIDEEDKVAYGTLNDGPQVTIKDLMPNTNYSLYVRTICPDGYTDWVEYDFETPCALEELPYTESFTETPECWILTNASVGTTQVGTSDEHEKWNRLSLNATSGMAILPELNVPLNKVEIEVGLFNTTTSMGAVQLGVMDNTWDVSTFKEIAIFQTVTKPGSTGTYTPTQLEVFNKMMNLYQGNGKVLAIKNATSNSIGIKYVKLTELPDCVKPQQLELTDLTDKAVTLNWLAGLEEAWDIQINDSIIENVTTNPFRITGLEQGTNYTISIRALCDENTKSEWSLPVTFQTVCGVNPLPLFEDFSGLAKPTTSSDLKKAMLTCWDNMVSQNNIDQVFAGKESPFTPANNVYVGDSWVSNWLKALGEHTQLHSYRRDGPTYRYKWFVSPQYAIEENASLSFDIRVCNNVGNAAKNSDRTYVAISLDNGKTWKKEDATLLTNLDSVYTTKVISLSKYAGKNIRVAFYDENYNSSHKIGEQPFLLIDNVRMNCSEIVPLADDACQGYDYENYGFSIKKEDLPLAGEDSTYTRLAVSQSAGCDTVYTLTLTTRPVQESQILYDTICQGDGYQFGDWFLTEPNPENQPYYVTVPNEYGCDVYTYLYLAVLPSDTTIMAPVEITNDMLPYQVDDYFTIPADYTIPADKNVRVDTILVQKGNTCSFNKYFVTMYRCERKTLLSDTICEDVEAYKKYNFNIAKENLPAANSYKRYDDTIRTAQGCDSVASLILFVNANDTMKIDTAVYNNELNLADYFVDEYFSIKQGTPVGEYDSLLSLGNCYYRLYNYEVKQCTRFANYETEICETETSYSGYGFDIESAELPAANSYKKYEKHVMTAEGCDSLVTLKLTVNALAQADSVKATIFSDELPYMAGNDTIVPLGSAPDIYVKNLNIGDCKYTKYIITVKQCIRESEVINDTICELADGYYANGFEIAKADMPAANSYDYFYRHETTFEGCDSIITLKLVVNKADTLLIEDEILNNELPYMVGNMEIIPADAPLGEQPAVVLPTGDCKFEKYVITVNQCKKESEVINVSICENAESYEDNGFSIAKADFPAVNATKKYERHELTAESCDSLITLMLTLKNDTVKTPVSVLVTDLPYKVDDYYTIPDDAPVGEEFIVTKQIGDEGCLYNRYIVKVSACGSQEIYWDSICQNTSSYQGYGFQIAANEYPAPGETKQYYRDEAVNEGCVHVTLNLTVNMADTAQISEAIFNNELPYMVGNDVIVPAGAALGVQPAVVIEAGDCKYTKYIITVNQCTKPSELITDNVCVLADGYYENGFSIAKADMPAANSFKIFTRHELTAESCDSVINLMLTVNKADTVLITDEILNNELPYMVGNEEIIPAGAPLGEQPAVVIETADCKYAKYIITVNQCSKQSEMITDEICEFADSYNANGFEIAKADMPAANSFKFYTRHELSAEGCDSIINLRLAVNKADTNIIPVMIENTQLPYIVDELYTVPADAAIGTAFNQIVKLDGCACNSYEVFIKRCVQEYAYTANICASATAYEGYGFSIPATDLPAVGQSKDYTRDGIHITSTCDSLITLTISVMKNDTTSYEDAICETQTAYQGHGFMLSSADLPAIGQSAIFYRSETSAQGCDSIIALSLAVVPNDTTVKTVNIDNTRLPYEVDPYYTVPADAVIGETFEKIIRLDEDECSYRKYIVTVTQCSRSFSYSETLCEGQQTFEGFGFAIAAADMPAIGTSKDFFRSNMSLQGCDSLITLTLIMKAADTTSIDVKIDNTQLPYYVDPYYTVPEDALVGQPFETIVKVSETGCTYNRYVVSITQVECSNEFSYADSICALAESYEGFGFAIAADKLPAAGQSIDYTRTAKDVKGCDSIITLTLKAYKPDTLYIVDSIAVNALPYVANGQIIVPAGAAAGEQPAVTFKSGDCAYVTYLITVLTCEIYADLTDEACVGSDYNEYGFAIKAADMPAAGQSKEFTRTNKSEAGCDSIITLTLSVKGDTIYLDPIEIGEEQLPYKINDYITIPVGTKPGVYADVIKLTDDCQFISYSLTIHEEGFGIIYVTDAVDYIEVYDILGHKITTIRQNEESQSLPTGVYMLRTIMKSGQIVNSKAALK